MAIDETAGQEIPLSERLTPVAPSKDRSKTYDEIFVNGQYRMNFQREPNYDPTKPIETKQRELFALLVDSEHGPIDAYEFLLSRKWDEMDAGDKQVIKENITPEQTERISPNVRVDLGL